MVNIALLLLSSVTIPSLYIKIIGQNVSQKCHTHIGGHTLRASENDKEGGFQERNAKKVLITCENVLPQMEK